MCLLIPRRLRRGCTLLGALAVVTLLSACGTTGSDYARRQEMVYVPAHAQPVDHVRWDHVRNFKPLNQRMILMDVRRRPHLLVLAKSCVGLRRDSIIVLRQRSSRFDPRRDAIGFANRGSVGNTITCFPDALYALEDEDVDAVIASL
ncbi:MAG: DUF6491 family protein [Pseudomonadota bacterium]